MSIEETLSQYPYPKELDTLDGRIATLRTDAAQYLQDADALQTMFNAIDLTTLNHTDSADSVRKFVERVNQFGVDFPKLKNVGGICVYSVFAPIVKSALRVEGVHRAVVSACFPSSQMFTDVKCVDVRKSCEAGATEVDVVISVGEFLAGNYEFVYEELVQIRQACTGRLKVILETGALPTHEQVWEASIIAMAAGADFIKTSTGKNCGGATPEAAIVMAEAIKAFVAKEGRVVGLKPSGGVSTAEEAALYYNIVRTVLGTEWLVNTRFRIGASRLANALLEKILCVVGEKERVCKYF